MTQRDLNSAASRATGESLSTVRRLGFLLAEPHPSEDAPDHDDLLDADVIDWDALDAQRPTLLPVFPRPAIVGC